MKNEHETVYRCKGCEAISLEEVNCDCSDEDLGFEEWTMIPFTPEFAEKFIEDYNNPVKVPELEMHCADHQAVRDAGFHDAGELLSAYNNLEFKYKELEDEIEHIRNRNTELAWQCVCLQEELNEWKRTL